MAAAYCYEGIPLRFWASLFDIQYEISMVYRHNKIQLLLYNQL